MASTDITFCIAGVLGGWMCPKKEACFRYTFTPKDGYVSMMFPPKEAENGECPLFIPNDAYA